MADIDDARGGDPSLSDIEARIERIRQNAERRRAALESAPRNVETDDELRARLLRRAAPARSRWAQRLPSLYRDASLASLQDGQHPEKVRAWLAGGAMTLFLAGKAGTGKTYAAYAIGAAANDVPVTVEAWNVVELLEMLLPGPDAASTLARVLKADLLVLDDMFAPKVTDWAMQTMYRIVDRRVNDERRQVITTNGSWSELAEKWGEPTLDRLSYRSQSLVFSGESRRRQTVGW